MNAGFPTKMWSKQAENGGPENSELTVAWKEQTNFNKTVVCNLPSYAKHPSDGQRVGP